MKKFLILFFVAAFFASCENEVELTSESTIEQIAEVSDIRAIPWPPKKFKIKIKLKIDSGTRKTADQYEEYGIGDGSKCQGRSMCLQTMANPGGGEDIVDGHAVFADANFEPYETQYAFTLANDLNGGFMYYVHPDDIMPETSEIVFEGGVFVMDADYEFTEEVSAELGVESCILPAGTYEVIENEDGIKSFEFYN